MRCPEERLALGGHAVTSCEIRSLITTTVSVPCGVTVSSSSHDARGTILARVPPTSRVRPRRALQGAGLLVRQRDSASSDVLASERQRKERNTSHLQKTLRRLPGHAVCFQTMSEPGSEPGGRCPPPWGGHEEPQSGEGAPVGGRPWKLLGFRRSPGRG